MEVKNGSLNDSERVERFIVQSLKHKGYCMDDVLYSDVLPRKKIHDYYPHVYRIGVGSSLLLLSKRVDEDPCAQALLAYSNMLMPSFDHPEAAKDSLVAIEGMSLEQLAEYEDKVIEYKYGVSGFLRGNKVAEEVAQGNDQLMALSLKKRNYERALEKYMGCQD